MPAQRVFERGGLCYSDRALRRCRAVTLQLRRVGQHSAQGRLAGKAVRFNQAGEADRLSNSRLFRSIGRQGGAQCVCCSEA